MRHLGLYLLLLTPLFAPGQVTLKPSIATAPLPANSDPICPWTHVSAPNGGVPHIVPEVGDTMADFTLYDVNDVAYTLSSVLNIGKPVLIVAGSYTCPKYYNSISVINDVKTTYGTDISILVVYMLEAHPTAPDTSAFTGTVWPIVAGNGQNYGQPVTYSDRKDIVADMLVADPITRIIRTLPSW